MNATDKMTDPTEQELAEYWARELGHKRDYPDHWNFIIAGHNWRPHKDHLARFMFHEEKSAPIIAHLIQEYMEGEDFWWRFEHDCDTNKFGAFYTKSISMKPGEWENLYIWNENKWIANALAAWRAKEGKKNE